jgi:hypothetical protein
MVRRQSHRTSSVLESDNAQGEFRQLEEDRTEGKIGSPEKRCSEEETNCEVKMQLPW